MAFWGIVHSPCPPLAPLPPQPLNGAHPIQGPAAAGTYSGSTGLSKGPILGPLVAHRRPHPKHRGWCIPNLQLGGGLLVPTTEAPWMEHLPPSSCAQRPAGLTSSLGGSRKCPAEGSYRAPGDSSPWKDLT